MVLPHPDRIASGGFDEQHLADETVDLQLSGAESLHEEPARLRFQHQGMGVVPLSQRGRQGGAESFDDTDVEQDLDQAGSLLGEHLVPDVVRHHDIGAVGGPAVATLRMCRTSGKPAELQPGSPSIGPLSGQRLPPTRAAKVPVG